jgi:hypothetical protein
MVSNGPPYSDAERVVLMLIHEHHEDLTSDQVTKVFNTVFNNQTRSRISLILTWHSRHSSDQHEAWTRLRDQPQAGHDLATRKQWLQAINTAVEQLDPPTEKKPQRAPTAQWSDNTAVQQLDQPSEKKAQRPPTAQWNDNMRLVLYLLIIDVPGDPNTRTRIFNVLFRDELARQGVAPLTKEALNAQWGLRNRKRKANGEGHQAESEKTRVAQKWQRIIDSAETGEDQANVALWQNKIKEQKEKSEEDEGEAVVEQEVEEGIDVHEPQRNQGEPSFDAREDVGDWRFGSWYDWGRAISKLGKRMAGMPASPLAEDVRRLRLQLKRAGRPDVWTQGIHIYPGLETVQWKLVGPNHLSRPQRLGQGASSSEPAHAPKNARSGVAATAMVQGGGDMDNSGGETVAEEAVKKNSLQESGPEDDPKAKKGSQVNLTPLDNCLRSQQELSDLLLRSGAKNAGEVRRLFEQLNQNTLTLLTLATYLAQVRELLQKWKSR